MKTAARSLLVALCLAAPAGSYALPSPAPGMHREHIDKAQKAILKRKMKEERQMRKAQKKAVKAWKKQNRATR